MDRAAIYAFMTRQRYGVVSSTATNGTPQSALVGITSTPGLEVIFDTVKSSRKYPNRFFPSYECGRAAFDRVVLLFRGMAIGIMPPYLAPDIRKSESPQGYLCFGAGFPAGPALD